MKKLFILFVMVLFFSACSSVSEENTSYSTTETINTEENSTESMAKIEGQTIVMETSKGDITLVLYDDTPITTGNFVSLIESGFYDGLTFHRYEPGFVVQGGDPLGTGMGGSEKTITLEIVSGRNNDRGTIAMARSSDPNSASSQFYFNLADNSFLDGSYAVFGEVTEGMDVVDSLRVGDTITKITVS